MPLRASQIVVQGAGLAALEPFLGRALRRQKASPAGETRTLIAFEAQGACTLCPLQRSSEDFGLARLLSELLPGPVFALWLDGAELGLRLRRFDAGEPRFALDEPGLLHADVEARAWQVLREAGVPASLRLCDASAIRLLDEGEGEGVPALVARVAADGVELSRAVALPPLQRESDEPPVRPDSVVESAAGERRALEVRTLAAPPRTDAEADALAAVEEAQALRLCSQLASGEGEHGADAGRVPRPSFLYRAPDGDRPRIEALLSAARARRPRLRRLLDPAEPPPLSHAGFNALCREALARELPEARIARAHGLRLELAGADAALRVPLLAAYEACLRDEPPARDPTVRVVDRAFELLENPLPLSAWPREAALRGLLPTVIPERDGRDRASGSLRGPLRSGLLCDDGARIAAVDEALLHRLGLRYDEALSLAVHNLDALSLAQPEGLSFLELEFGRVAFTDFDDPGGAGRLLSPVSRAMLLALFGEACLVAVPTRDTLLACVDGDGDAEAFLRDEARTRFAEGPYSIDPTPLRMTEDGLEPFA